MALLHEFKCKLICLTSEAETLIHDLLRVYSLNNVTKNITDPNEALADILTQYFCGISTGVKDIRSLNYEDNKKKIFTTLMGNRAVQKEITIDSLDLTLAVDILRNVPEFLSCSKKHRLVLQCSRCGCVNNKNKIVCCKQCLLCKSCMGSTPTCQSSIVQTSVTKLKRLRNRAMHITKDDCLLIEQANTSGSLDWELEINGYGDAIKCLIKILKTHLTEKVARKKKHNIEFIITESRDLCALKFFSSIQQFVGNVKPFAKDLEVTFNCKASSKELHALKNIDSRPSKIVSSSFEANVEHTLTNKLNIRTQGNFKVKVVGLKFTPSYDLGKYKLNLTFVVHVTSNSDDIPVCYETIHSTESEILREELINVLMKIIKNVLGINVTIECNAWLFNSIHIEFTISPIMDDLSESSWPNLLQLKEVLGHAIDNRHILLNRFLEDFGMAHCDVSCTFPVICPGITCQLQIRVFDEVLYDDFADMMPIIQSICTEEFMKMGL